MEVVELDVGESSASAERVVDSVEPHEATTKVSPTMIGSEDTLTLKSSHTEIGLLAQFHNVRGR